MEKVIFLDVDGVLNSGAWEKYLTENCYFPSTYYFNLLEQRAILLLTNLVQETNAKIVLSSSWRISSLQTDSIAQQLAPYKLEIYSSTPFCSKRGRGYEIKTWLNEHKEVKRFVILDDDDIEDDELAPFLVRTTWERGLQKEHVEKAVAILNNKLVAK